MLQVHIWQTLRNQPVHLVTFTCGRHYGLCEIEYTGTSALTKLLYGTPHGGGPYSHDDTLQGIK